ncbi:metal-dependent transcriptional regulator [Saccharopolyspora taberi]|uniref:Metal-dependent transcriptional regulator n=1 Tax=Saccharopolyspora taberi TaxID=60895 RepID=A0ABN3VDG1_9PSEU
MTAEGLIDTTEMYLKALFELAEDGVVPLRARIVERLGHRAPTVSGTVARMEREGLVRVRDDRRIELTGAGFRQAVRVTRKHRLLEAFLHQVVELEWDQVHVEACRWEHVVSDRVEQRIFELCGRPRTCPHGNPVPGLEELSAGAGPADVPEAFPVAEAVTTGRTSVVVSRVSERVQEDVAFLRSLHEIGALPGARVELTVLPGAGIALDSGGGTVELTPRQAETLMVAEDAACSPADGGTRPRVIGAAS